MCDISMCICLCIEKNKNKKEKNPDKNIEDMTEIILIFIVFVAKVENFGRLFLLLGFVCLAYSAVNLL